MAARHPRSDDHGFTFSRLPHDPSPLLAADPGGEPAVRARGRRPRRAAGTERRHGYRGALALALVMGAVAAVAWTASTEAIEAGSRGLGWLAAHDTARGRALLTVVCVTVAALALTLAWGRETSERRPVRLAGGRARMAVDEVAATLREALLEEVALADAEVRVANLHRRGLRVSVRADVEPRARIDETVEAVDGVVAEVVLDGLGSRLAARPAVDVRYRELDLRWSDGSVGRG